MIDGLKRDVPAFLASVTSPDEALLALSGGANLIDCKDPSQGALGALDTGVIGEVVAAIAGRAPASATIGDLPPDPDEMVRAAEAAAATGVDLVKVGFFGDADPRLAISALGSANLGRTRLVAVLMADRQPDWSLVVALAQARFAGVMLDTADKGSGALPDVLGNTELVAFLASARAQGLSAGLAGALRLKHIAGLIALRPDVIGFRGALCAGGRTDSLEFTRVRAVRDCIDAAVYDNRPVKRSVA